MNRQPVVSVAISSIGYDPDTRHLEIEMRDGHFVAFAEVPAELHRALMLAESRIAFVHERIEGRYPSCEPAAQ